MNSPRRPDPASLLALRIPPLVIFTLVAALMELAALLFPTAGFREDHRDIVALSLGAVGVSIAIAGVVSFRRAKTTVNPLKPDAALAVRHGIPA